MPMNDNVLMWRADTRYYTGFRPFGEATGPVQVYWHEGQSHGELPLHLELWNHSPDGFNWGYGGSGPAQLALALCHDLLGNAGRALDAHQIVKRELVSHFPHHCWILSGGSLLDLINTVEGS